MRSESPMKWWEMFLPLATPILVGAVALFLIFHPQLVGHAPLQPDDEAALFVLVLLLSLLSFVAVLLWNFGSRKVSKFVRMRINPPMELWKVIVTVASPIAIGSAVMLFGFFLRLTGRAFQKPDDMAGLFLMILIPAAFAEVAVLQFLEVRSMRLRHRIVLALLAVLSCFFSDGCSICRSSITVPRNKRDC